MTKASKRKPRNIYTRYQGKIRIHGQTQKCVVILFLLDKTQNRLSAVIMRCNVTYASNSREAKCGLNETEFVAWLAQFRQQPKRRSPHTTMAANFQWRINGQGRLSWPQSADKNCSKNKNRRTADSSPKWTRMNQTAYLNFTKIKSG